MLAARGAAGNRLAGEGRTFTETQRYSQDIHTRAQAFKWLGFLGSTALRAMTGNKFVQPIY